MEYVQRPAIIKKGSPTRDRKAYSFSAGKIVMGNRSQQQWVSQYSASHTHPMNRLCHALGIPMIALSLPLFLAAFFMKGLWPLPAALFAVGWLLQFVGHYFEGKPPEFFHDPRFLLVGLRWWIAKVRGRA